MYTWEVYLVDDNGNPIGTEFHEISGNVTGPNGRKSIRHHTEVALEGANFEFEFRWLDTKLKAQEVAEIIAFMGNAGLGSVRSMAYGGFEVLEMTIDDSPISQLPKKSGRKEGGKKSA